VHTATHAVGSTLANAPAFRSFFIGGFEGADHVNGDGVALDLNALTGHAFQLRGDYRRARALGMREIRESVGWRVTGSGARPDFRRALAMVAEANRHDMAIAWTLWHYGFPPHVDPFSSSLPERFADFAFAFANAIASVSEHDVWINPINEISFLTWLLTETAALAPFRGDRTEHAHALKRNLVRAAILATAAVRQVIPGARFFHTDPIIHVDAPHQRDDLTADARAATQSQFEAWDLFTARDFAAEVPVAKRVHLLGANYYHASQWEVGTRKPLAWHLNDPRRLGLAGMLERVGERYALPVAITETSHVGAGRSEWMRHVGAELRRARADGIRCEGVCLYPLIDRPDWDEVIRWHCSGMWDVVPRLHPRGGRRQRVHAYVRAFREVRRSLLELSAVDEAGAAAPSVTPARMLLSPRRDTSNKGASMDSLIVFSHLRWDFVYQRPQHVMSRLARTWRILFVEEPLHHDGEPAIEMHEAVPNVVVVRMHTPRAQAGFHDDHLGTLRRLLSQVVRDLRVGSYGAWLYTPMALPLLRDLSPRLIVYDCMDELSAFKNAPKQLVQRESALMKIANVVFTGGPSLYRRKRELNAKTHCVPSSVDATHFRRARDAREANPSMAALPRPRLGFYGVVDERFDATLLAGAAALRPDWQFVVVGPMVKIDPETLPHAPNIHYFGQQPYDFLPGVLASWDVCLLPFARNESTRYISPTKTLEYLAADKPVVSTGIADVIELYGSAVRIANTPEELVREVDSLLGETALEREERVAKGRELVRQSSWDTTAAYMRSTLEEALPEGLKPDVALFFGDASSASVRARSPHPHPEECLILGAGPTGLSAALHYGGGATLLEAESSVGGWCRSIRSGGFTFDHAGHIMFSDSPIVQELYKVLLGDNVVWQEREAWIYSHDVYTRYPYQGALYGLPPDVIKECLLGAVEARSRSMAPLAATRVHDDCCADGTEVCATRAGAAPANFEEFIYQTWGSGIAKHFAVPYNCKLWGVPLNEMETSWLGGRVPMPDLEAMIDGALKPVPRPMGPNARFGYPRVGGFQALMDGFLPLLKGELHLRARVQSVSPSRRLVELEDGSQFTFESLISTIPLPELVRMMGHEAPVAVRAAAARLRRVSVRCVHLGVGRSHVTDKHWIYYPGDTVFHRIFVQGNTSPYCNPPGGFGLTCEITHSPTKPLPCTGQALIDRCVADCIRVGMLSASDTILVAHEVDLPYAYVLYDHERAASVSTIRSWLQTQGITLAGRYSEWEYYNSDHAFLAGKRAAEEVAAARAKASVRAGTG